MKYLYTAYQIFDTIADSSPEITGCYQWIRAFKGDSLSWRDVDKDNLEKYDVIQINADWTDLRLVGEIRDILGDSSSTKIVLNQDHAPELWQNSFEFIQDFKQAMKMSDCVFATSPTARDLMQQIIPEKKIYLSPHPCETHVLKSFRSVHESNHILALWHRYDKFSLIPSIILKGLDIPVSLGGWIKEQDNVRVVKTSNYGMFIEHMNFPDFMKLIYEARIAYDAFTSYSVGRVAWDCSALSTPLVCSNRNWSSRICYPLTSFDPFSAKELRSATERLIKDKNFYEEVKNLAYYNCEFAGHEACRNRFNDMLADIEIVEPTKTEIRRGEANQN